MSKECASEITPYLNGHKGTPIHCKEPRLEGKLFCARHEHASGRIYLAVRSISEYDYYRTGLDRFKD